MKKSLKLVAATLGAIAVLAAILVYTGWYNVAADQAHTPLGKLFFETVRERSIAVRSDDIEVPDLDDDALIANGAGHYEPMCAGCHLAPGMDDTELRQGLLPQPPNLAEHGIDEPEKAFWIIKHGIRMSGMPAWGVTHDDESLWGLVAFARQLPEMSAEKYQAMISAGGGHDHGSHDHGGSASSEVAGAESDRHDHAAHDHGDEATAESSGGHSHAAPETPVEIVDAFHHALEEGRGDTALSFLADDVLILEGGHAQTREEYAAGHLGSDMKFLGAMNSERLSREIRKSGEQVTIVTQSRLSGHYRDQDVDIVSSETAVVAKRDGEWKIVHLHWSN